MKISPIAYAIHDEGDSRYPAWVCSDCGQKYGRRIPSLATYHIGVCGVCSKETMVTEPRDYGHLDFEVKQ